LETSQTTTKKASLE